jgi:hypothetical protein
VSLCVQALPSLHDTPFGLAGLLQAPVVTLHVPTSWHWSCGVHTTSLPPVHTPPRHESVLVQASLSLHEAPSDFGGSVHEPLAASHVPATWHWSSGEHATGFDPVHVPVWHVSV